MAPTPGIGVWVWYADKANPHDGPLTDSLQMLWDSGVRRLYLKSGDGSNAWQDALRLADKIKSDGWDFSLWGWHYSYKPSFQESKALKIEAHHPFDGLVLDIESEYKDLYVITRNQQTAGFIQNVRQEWDGWPIWVASFAYPQYHSNMPWRGLMEADGFMPQLFPGYSSASWSGLSCDQIVRNTIQQHISVGVNKPIIPLWEPYNEKGNPIGVERFKEVLETGRNALPNIEIPFNKFPPTIDFFRWGVMGAEQWGAIQEFGQTTEQPVTRAAPEEEYEVPLDD